MRQHQEFQLLPHRRKANSKRVQKKAGKRNPVRLKTNYSIPEKSFTKDANPPLPFHSAGPSLQALYKHFSNGGSSENTLTTKNQIDPSSWHTRDLARKMLFQVVYLGDEDQSVEVEEVDEIDFAKLKTRLDEGKSVFITRKESEKIELFPADIKPWNINHL